ncbi:hypothetical protein DZG03_06680, partial [Clavibacter phaseoli]
PAAGDQGRPSPYLAMPEDVMGWESVGASAAGRVAVARLRELLEVRERTSEFTVMPARGLVLERVGYPADGDLAARNEITRARRAAHEVDAIAEGAAAAARDLARLADTPGIA